MKHQANKIRSKRHFEVGDTVFVKLKPYAQSLLANQTNYKLSFRYLGLFQIIEKITPAAYKLKLPDHNSVHLVFHVS